MIKDILVNLGLQGSDPAGDFAVSVAALFEAHLVAVAVDYEPIIPGATPGVVPPEFIESQKRDSEKAVREAAARFSQIAERQGVSFEAVMINDDVGGAAEQLGQMARRFDLAVIGQSGPEKGMPEEVVVEGLLFGAGGPVIVVPYIQKTPIKLDHVLVCWDGSRNSARAVADAIPLLGKAKAVEIVIVSRDGGKRDELPGADLGQHLARHGITTSVTHLTAPDIDVADTILSYVSDSDTDFLVMGGYGHSRLREFVLGGVTRGILSSMTVPTLMSH
jgi:nucleotide-binding universal stress UspA family protein